MRKKLLALIIVVFSLLIITPISSAQLVCEEVFGLNWCYNNAACGQPCNDVCATGNMQPIQSNQEWFEAQDSAEECLTIANAFGLNRIARILSYVGHCPSDQPVIDHPATGLTRQLLCSSNPDCPETVRTEVEDNAPCESNAGFSQRFICPCEPILTINLSPDTATNDVGTEHTVTAAAQQYGAPLVGEFVEFRVLSGPNLGEMSDPDSGECTPNDDCTTDSNGEVSWTYSSQLIGTDTIVALIFNGTIEDAESNVVEKIWVITRNVPTLNEWGLIAMAGLLGIIGLLAIRRRKAAT